MKINHTLTKRQHISHHMTEDGLKQIIAHHMLTTFDVVIHADSITIDSLNKVYIEQVDETTSSVEDT